MGKEVQSSYEVYLELWVKVLNRFKSTYKLLFLRHTDHALYVVLDSGLISNPRGVV